MRPGAGEYQVLGAALPASQYLGPKALGHSFSRLALSPRPASEICHSVLLKELGSSRSPGGGWEITSLIPSYLAASPVLWRASYGPSQWLCVAAMDAVNHRYI